MKLYGPPAENYLQEVPRWFPRLEGNRIALWNEFSPRAVRSELHCLLIELIFGLKALSALPLGHVALTGLRARLF